jgi:hypothetical protein
MMMDTYISSTDGGITESIQLRRVRYNGIVIFKNKENKKNVGDHHHRRRPQKDIPVPVDRASFLPNIRRTL